MEHNEDIPNEDYYREKYGKRLLSLGKLLEATKETPAVSNDPKAKIEPCLVMDAGKVNSSYGISCQMALKFARKFKIDESLQCSHWCGNRRCLRLNHLLAETVQANNARISCHNSKDRKCTRGCNPQCIFSVREKKIIK